MSTDLASLSVTRDPSRGAHHFTVDVEEYFQVSAFEPFVARAAWETMETRLAYGVTRLLELLEKHGGLGTFFVLGWVADRHPEMIRAIAAAGHEIASHGWDHRRVTDQTPEDIPSVGAADQGGSWRA